MIVAADYPFLDVMWTLIVVVAWVLWIWMVIAVLTDVFRRDDAGGAKKVVWTLVIVILPLIGVLIYLVANGDGMATRSAKREQAGRARLDDHIRAVATPSGAAGEIERAKALLDQGVISQAEFDAIKSKALA